MLAVGIIRQSRGREDSLSPAEQRGRIEDVCRREGLELVAVHEEIDVSGGTPLAEREGLRAAVEAVEGKVVSVVVVAYFDRLFRSLTVQAEVVERIEAAGGRILAADVGEVSGATPAQWISGTMLGVVSEYYRRSVRERSGEAQRLAIAEGRPPFGAFPPGYEVGPDRKLVPNGDAPAVAEAFRLRAAGVTIKAVRAFLRERGIERSYHGVQSVLRSRIVLGELHFGELHNLAAHEPIVDPATWEAAQGGRRGPRPRSDRLLARLGVLRCGTCGGRMVVGMQTQNGRRYPFYRCSPVGDCSRRVTIGAEIVEDLVVGETKRILAGIEGRASAEEDARRAEAEVERTQAALDSALRAFDGFDEPAAVERLGELRDARDHARQRAAHLGDLRSALVVTVEDWEVLTLAAQRALVRVAIERVEVAPGRGVDRVTVHPRGEQAAGLG